MQHANRTGQPRVIAIATVREAEEESTIFEVAMLSLAGLAFTLFTIAHGFGLDFAQLTLLQ